MNTKSIKKVYLCRKRSMIMEEFKLSNQTAKHLSPDILKQIHSEGKERLKDLRDQESATTGRGYTLLGIYITLFIATVGYLYLHWDEDFAFVFSMLLFAIGVFFGIAFMLAVVLPRDHMPIGRAPSDYHLSEWAATLNGKEFKDEAKLMALLTNEINELERAIQEQAAYNRVRTVKFKYSIISCIIGILASILFFFFLTAL